MIEVHLNGVRWQVEPAHVAEDPEGEGKRLVQIDADGNRVYILPLPQDAADKMADLLRTPNGTLREMFAASAPANGATPD